MILGSIITIIFFIALYAICEKFKRDPVGWCILGLFITPFGAIVAVCLYTLITEWDIKKK